MSLVALLTNFVTVYSIMYQLGTRRTNEKESEGTIFTHNEATGRRICAICMCVQTQTFEQYFCQSKEMHRFAFQLTGKRQWGKQYVFSPCAKMLLSYSNNVLFIVKYNLFLNYTFILNDLMILYLIYYIMGWCLPVQTLNHNLNVIAGCQGVSMQVF